jgi:ferritin
MLKKSIEKALNDQVKVEALSSQHYLAMASWAEVKGYNGTAEFLYTHSDEERMHMLKLFRYINERGGVAIVPELEKPTTNFKGLDEVFQALLNHEIKVSEEINGIVELCLKEKDFTTHNFMQWYVSEQMEEEALAKTIIDKLNLLQGDKSGLYIFDKDLASIRASMQATANQ